MALQLLSTGNPKTLKSLGLGYSTAVLHLAPADLAGVGNMCPHSTAGCREACLNTAGRGGLFQNIKDARKRKTIEFKEDKVYFLKRLKNDIERHIRSSERHGLIPCVRLNGTSDILWESIRLDGKSLMEHFPKLQFYDYTKYPSRRAAPPNYHLTFSLAENNEAKAAIALGRGVNVAVVFHRSAPLPTSFEVGGKTVPVVNGDKSDLRFLDPPGVVVGLLAKGRARRDTSGFVRTP